MSKWWKNEPLRFECQPDCFKCCEKPGEVYFDREDIQSAAKHLNTTTRAFKAAYLKREDGHHSLQVTPGEPCTFLTPEGCGIHPAKPKQCQAYPFWKDNLESKSMWQLVGGFCPGIDRGPMVPLEIIKDYLKKFRM